MAPLHRPADPGVDQMQVVILDPVIPWSEAATQRRERLFDLKASGIGIVQVCQARALEKELN